MMMANPYFNPYTNPFMNPYMAQGQVSPGNAALYFLAAQQMNGGIGSGRLGGPRATGALGTNAARPGAAIANANADRSGAGQAGAAGRGASNRPGASAARYFARDYPASAAGPGRYYNRDGRHFPGIGR
jgi:hypothetical protein